MLYTILSVSPLFVCLFWLITLLLDNHKNNSKRFLAFFMAVCVVNYFVHVLFFNHHYRLYSIFDSIWVFTSLSVYPLYYLYIRLLTKDTKINLKWGWVLIPSISLALFTSILYLLMSPEEIRVFIHDVMYRTKSVNEVYPPLVKLQILRLTLFKIIYVPQIILTVYAGRKLILAYNSEIKTFYSDTEKKDLTPIQKLLWVFLLTSLVSLLASVIGKSFFVDNTWLIATPMLIFSVLLFGIGFMGQRQDFTIEDFQKDLNEAEINRHPLADDKKSEIINNELFKKRLFQLLEEEKIFYQTDLRITDVAGLLNTNRTYISKIINDDLKTNFSDLINNYRIIHAKNLLLDCANDALSLSEIGENSGFSSDSSFYRIFKNKVGVSPGDFRKKRCSDTEL